VTFARIDAADRPLRNDEIGNAEPVNEHEAGQRHQGADRLAHRLERGAMDVQAVDVLGGDNGGGPGNRRARDFGKQAIAIVRREDFGVGDARHVVVGLQNDGRRDDRAGQTTPTDLVDPRDVHKPPAPDLVLHRA